MTEPKDLPAPPEPSPPAQPVGADFDTTALFGGRSEIRISHQNVVYRLLITRAGKLILNK